MTIRKIAALLAVLCCVPALALADDDEGAYVALNVGRGNFLHGCSSPGVVANCTDNRGYAYFATYGYQYTSMWGLEANYGKMGNFSNVRALGLAVEGVATLRMGDVFAVFVKAGLGYMDFHEDIPNTVVKFNQSGYSPAGGAGLQFDFTPKLAMRVQADYFGGYTPYDGSPKVNAMVTSAGLMVKY